jgi:ABC-type sugar transport system substrate-binding protein
MACRIALFLMDSGDYQELLWDDCQHAAHKFGFPVRAFWADNDSKKQAKQIQSCLGEPEYQRPTLLLCCPVREIALISTARTAASLGVGWVAMLRWNDYINDLRQEFGAVPIFCVTTDQREVGRIQGRQVRTLLPSGGTLLYIRGPLGTSSAMGRFAGVQEVLNGSSVGIVTLNADWSAEGGERALLEWARSAPPGELPPRLLVAAQNDAMAMGARKALEEIARERPAFAPAAVRVCGCDGTPRFGQRLVNEGKLTATVIMPPVAGRAVSDVASMLDGGARPPAQVVLPPASFPDLPVLARFAG